MKSASRRSFLRLVTSAAAAVTAAPAEALSAGVTASEPSTAIEHSSAPAASKSPKFVPDVTLECAFLDKVIDGHKVRLRAYNKQVPGPMIETTAGRTLKIRVINSLSDYPNPGWNGDMNVPHEMEHTNLHLHGLDIAEHIFEPLGTSDYFAPMVSIAPGEYKDYPFKIPADQAPGLNWYHPHSHGSTAIQGVSGMAGGLIIKGAIDEVPQIKAARDIPLVVQDIGLFPADLPTGDFTDGYLPQENAIWQTYGGKVTRYDTKSGTVEPTNLHCGFTTGDYALRYFLLNGEPFFKEEHNPALPSNPTPTQMTTLRFTMRPGEVVRFRFLNACSDLMIPLQVEGHIMYTLAMDGNNFDAPQAHEPRNNVSQAVLGPANRVEFLIKAGKPGIYRILQLEQTAQFLTAAQKTIAEIEIAGEPMDMQFPTKLPSNSRHPPILDADIKRVRYFVFSSAFPGRQNPTVGIDFYINNQLYDEFAVPTTVFLDECEEWHIVVPNGEHGGTEGHPVHIHVNAFEVKAIAGIEQPQGLIQDTIWVQQNTASVIRIRFKDWIGKSVFHCHILPHEDTGMMQNFMVADRRPPMHMGENSVKMLKK